MTLLERVRALVEAQRRINAGELLPLLERLVNRDAARRMLPGRGPYQHFTVHDVAGRIRRARRRRRNQRRRVEQRLRAQGRLP